MNPVIRIALDAMGGDHAPQIVVEGAALALRQNPALAFTFFGDVAELRPYLAAHSHLQAAVVVHTADRITGDMKPSVALRQGRNSSMRLAINAVGNGEADAVVSAGNTGALMALARFVFGTLPGIDRPAIVSVLPTIRGRVVLLDLGANLECTPDNLVQFAIMGSLVAQAELGLHTPSVGLLNIGTEEMKGHDEIRAAAAILKETPLPGRFVGYVEADAIPSGKVDVVVTDGFTGNVVLKTAEGTAKLCASFLRGAMHASWLAKLGGLLAYGAFQQLKKQLDPRDYNGALLVGLQGVCVKSHGGTDARGFANAIGVAAKLVHEGLNERIKMEFARLYGMNAPHNSLPQATLIPNNPADKLTP